MKKQITPTKLVINNFDSVMPFGKYKGYKIRYIVDNEPSYILWLFNEGIVEFSDEIWHEAMENDEDDDGYRPEDFDMYWPLDD